MVEWQLNSSFSSSYKSDETGCIYIYLKNASFIASENFVKRTVKYDVYIEQKVNVKSYNWFQEQFREL